MSKTGHKHYACIHDLCPFRTDKRKAIYTHLIRTHAERKEDYECEYCSSMFEVDLDMERHLHVKHPEQPFTYTCVSRIEKVINNCAKLGDETKKSKTPVKSPVSDSTDSKTPDSVTPTKTPPKNETASTSPISKPPYSKPNISMRTRASVNASLNNIANQPKQADDNEAEIADDKAAHEKAPSEHYNGDGDVQDDADDFDADTDEESPTYISEPSGLKIKLSLKKAGSEDSGDMSTERSTSPPILEPNYTYQLDSVDTMDSFNDDAPPDIMRAQTTAVSAGMAQVRMKDSKYYDKLEVYHRTDEFGRRCCPFCDYKTSKNTIRVHLSGIHKIHFVKCSLCDYRAAFPHQITQHGIKFHKTTNMNVIQLSKESRDRTIAHLKRYNGDVANTDNVPAAHGMNVDPMATAVGNKAIIDDVDFNSEESVSSADDIESSSGMPTDERHFKPPKCQTSKTDYYSIRVENGVYMYTCNLCTFQTPVRATIYTHKYRHEEKSYRCGYCDFTSAPRSNVVHHCRVKHKTLPVSVFENDDNDDTMERPDSSLMTGNNGGIKENSAGQYPPDIKVEPLDTDTIMNHSANGEAGKYHVDSMVANQNEDKSHQTIIKVPQFKRSFGADAFTDHLQTKDGTIPTGNVAPGVEYKLSLNKLYRVNPLGSPKFMCALCPYACDTHPKMKHHLYRHRPQKYKCPYCDHRKYPRSYVVRHVRDTHRNKPVRVIDLSKGNEPEDIPEYANDSLVDDIDDTADNITGEDLEGAVDLDPALTNQNETSNDMISEGIEEQHEEVNALKQFAQKLNLRSVLTSDLQDDMFINTPDVNPSINDAAYTSTPLIDSFISGKYPNNNNSNLAKQQSKNFEKKKSLKDYRVNYGQGPRYICNKCGYGTENYKTIHNHMYRHESQRYQCPYCGYRRSPKSFVENHIREVHKGHPVIVTELNVDQEMSDTQNGSPRQNSSLKRKEHPSDIDSLSSEAYPDLDTEIPAETNASCKLPARWPAHKPSSDGNMDMHPDLKEEMSTSLDNDMDCSPDIEHLKATEGFTSSLSNALSSPSMVAQPVKIKQFVERNRTTFKSIYKCVFDPETCNHISKDKSKMKQHLFMHVEYKPWTCDICDMTASQSSHIKNHVRTEHKFAPDTSFKYKRHNYLEKHIEGFLSRGLYTVPVNEYRAIMDMKGNTKSSKQPCFDRDVEGNLLCPYCPYRTKTGGMTDHVKMKHMQPRFKCHWCDFTAFYKSEVRKHHRKEKAHGGLDFIVQELDLIQVVERCKNQGTQAIATLNTPNAVTNVGIDPSLYFDEDCDDFNDENSECSSSDSSSLTDFQQGCGDYTADELSGILKEPNNLNELKDTIEPNETEIVGIKDLPLTDNQALSGAINTEIGPDGCMKIVPKSKHTDANEDEGSDNEDKFRCGFCSFSAALRVKVKMHSSKRHPNLDLNILEPVSKREQSRVSENRDLNAADWKGTKFEQDLKRAGVSKLNLASLFPNSKRFVSGNKSSNESREKNADKNISSQGDANSKVEFKKPLDPIVKKVDKKLELESDSCSDTSAVDEIVKDDGNVSEKPGGMAKAGEKESQYLVISNVRSLNDDDSKPRNNETKTDSVEDPPINETSNDEVNKMSNESGNDNQKSEPLKQNRSEEGVSAKDEMAQNNSVGAVKQVEVEKSIEECKADIKEGIGEGDDKMANVEIASEKVSLKTSATECNDVKEVEKSNDKVTEQVETSNADCNVVTKEEESDINENVGANCKENGVNECEDSEIPDANEGIYALDGTLKDNQDICNNVSSELSNDIDEYTECAKKRKRLDGTEDTTADFNDTSEDDVHPLKKMRNTIDGII
ncbi:hypothetical protein ACF0H5_017762 [Mactra antiquata]